MGIDISGWKTRLTDDMIDRYSSEGIWLNTTLAERAVPQVLSHAGRVNAVEGSRGSRFEDLLSSATRLADALAKSGLKPGDVISFQLPNWLEAMTINLAACLNGYICNPIVPIYRDAEVGFILADARAKVFFIPEKFRNIDYIEMTRRLLPQLPDLKEVVVLRGDAHEFQTFESLLASGSESEAHAAPPDANAVKLLFYTSGTTGKPKGVLHSHNTIMAELEAVISYWKVTDNDVILMPSPVTHATGYLYALELPFLTGAKIVLMDRWNAFEAVDLIEMHGITMSIGATPFLAELVAEAEHRRIKLHSLRMFACGGAPVAPEIVHRANDALPNCLVSRVFGLTEAPTVTLGVNSHEDRELGAMTDGRIMGHEVLILDPEGEAVPEGAEGEIVTRGPEVMLGYTDWAETEKSFTHDGYFRTGDSGFRSHGDFITISGRIKDLIIRGGENLSPKDIEDALHRHPAIRDVAVVAMPHERLGETPCAFVELKPGESLDLQAVREFLETARVARQKFPEKLVVVEELPRTASGKIQKQILRTRAKALLAEGQ
jgi:acyl-CoA synthetase (AMP-forming)/AMP-acid ligase II